MEEKRGLRKDRAMIIENIKTDPLIYTAEELAMRYAREYEGDVAAERVRQYFEEQRQHRHQLAMGWVVLGVVGAVAGIFFQIVSYFF
jgi:hypothetical protein